MADGCPIALDRTGSDIHGEAARIRAAGRVARIELPGGVLAWSITDYSLAHAVLADNRFSKDPRKHWKAFRDGEIGEDFPLIGWVLMDNLTTAYGADHRRLRKLTSSAFTPRRVDGMRSAVAAIADSLLDRMAEREVVDIKADYAQPLAAQVICDLFGVPEHARDEMLRGYQVNVDTTISPEEAAANVAQWHREMQDFIDSKRTAPGDDLTSDLIAARDSGSRLSDSELVDTLHLLLATGTEPVMNLITNAVQALLANPEQLGRVVAGEVPWREAIEETLRVEAPVAHLPFRFAVEDVEIDGVVIPAGEPVLMHFAGAGRDPRVHGETADRFDVDREDKRHLAFGHGIYRCIGMPLAWLEVETALAALFARFPALALAVPAEDVVPQATFIMNGRAALPVRPRGVRSAAA